jgi:hypothetical protein
VELRPRLGLRAVLPARLQLQVKSGAYACWSISNKSNV